MICALYAGILGLMYCALSGRIMLWRFMNADAVVAGGQADETKLGMIRAHANFFEFVPLALILIAIAEQGRVAPVWIHLLGGGLVVARLAHAIGVSRTPGVSLGRRVGAGLTMLVLGAASIGCVVVGTRALG